MHVVEVNVEVGQFSTRLGSRACDDGAAKAREALELLAETEGVDVLFSDLAMHGMGAWSSARGSSAAALDCR